jgi:hypothetical protein
LYFEKKISRRGDSNLGEKSASRNGSVAALLGGKGSKRTDGEILGPPDLPDGPEPFHLEGEISSSIRESFSCFPSKSGDWFAVGREARYLEDPAVAMRKPGFSSGPIRLWKRKSLRHHRVGGSFGRDEAL